jgi:hypothetical protein
VEIAAARSDEVNWCRRLGAAPATQPDHGTPPTRTPKIRNFIAPQGLIRQPTTVIHPWFQTGFGLSRWLAAIALLGAALAWAGCSGKAKHQAERDRAFAAGMEQGRLQAQGQAQKPPITFRGPVRHPQIPWAEGLTLTRALLTAEVTSLGTPRAINVIRQGQSYPVNPRRLADGSEEVDLEPGDIIEILR